VQKVLPLFPRISSVTKEGRKVTKEGRKGEIEERRKKERGGGGRRRRKEGKEEQKEPLSSHFFFFSLSLSLAPLPVSPLEASQAKNI
jgi:hypothetical protein